MTRGSARRCRRSSTSSRRAASLICASHLGRPKGKVVPRPCAWSPWARGWPSCSARDHRVLVTDEPAGDGARKVVADMRDGRGGAAGEPALPPGREEERRGLRQGARRPGRRLRQRRLRHRPPGPRLDGGVVPLLPDKGGGLSDDEGARVPRAACSARSSAPSSRCSAAPRSRTRSACSRTCSPRVDALLIGGAMANTFLKAQGGEVGASMVEEDNLDVARKVMAKAPRTRGSSCCCRSDVVAAAALDAPTGAGGRRGRRSPRG